MPKIKGLPDGLEKKLENRKAKFDKVNLEWRKTRLEYLKEKIKVDALIDVSLAGNEELSPALVVNKSKWVRPVQAALLNNSSKSSVKLPPDLAQALKDLVQDRLMERCLKLLNHWHLPASSENHDLFKAKQLIFLLQTDLEAVKNNMNNDAFTVKQLKQESRRKELLQNHVKITRELVSNHALGHVATLNRLHVDYISAKKKYGQSLICGLKFLLLPNSFQEPGTQDKVQGTGNHAHDVHSGCQSSSG